MGYESKIKEANETISKVVFDLFNTFANPSNRGPAFSWSEFPKICGIMAATYVYVNVAADRTLENYARERAIKIAKGVRKRYAV